MDTSNTKNKYIARAAFVVACLFVFGFHTASAATLRLVPSSSAVTPGQSVTVSVFVDSGADAINDAGATIQFPADVLTVSSVSKNGSLLTLWVQDPIYSNTSGTVTFEGGVPNPGYSGNGGFLFSMVFKAKKAGTASLVLSNAAVRANDGLGTDVLSAQLGATIIVSEPEEIPTEEPVVTPVKTPQSSTRISSGTHPDQARWYNNNSPEFSWIVPKGTDSVRTAIGKNIDTIPSVTYSPAVDSKTVQNLDDGTYYFKLRMHTNGVWGSILSYTVKIDTLAPDVKKVAFVYDDASQQLTLTVNAKDALSGLDHYDIYVNDKLVKTVLDSEFIAGVYNLPLIGSGDSTVKLETFDAAGNSTVSAGSFHAEQVIAPTLVPVGEFVSTDEPLVIRGVNADSRSMVTVMVKHENGAATLYKAVQDEQGNFFALIPTLRAGNYDVWAQAGNGDHLVLSEHIVTTATPRMILRVGSFSTIARNMLPALLAILIIVILGILLVVRRYTRAGMKLSAVSGVSLMDNGKMLATLKSHLEKHLKILQDIRRKRLLTETEKEIKSAIENDLDEVDAVIEKHTESSSSESSNSSSTS